MSSCHFILVAGVRKGTPCGKNEYYQGYCKRHAYKLKITDESQRVKCSAVYQSGYDKGKPCNNTAKYKGFCRMHAKSNNICVMNDGVIDNKDFVSVNKTSPVITVSNTTPSNDGLYVLQPISESVDKITDAISVIQISPDGPSIEFDVINECKICMEHQINTLVMQCKHSCMCDKCAIDNLSICPICRGDIEKIITFYNC